MSKEKVKQGITVEDVPRWVIKKGIGHAVQSWREDIPNEENPQEWTTLLCGDVLIGKAEHFEDTPKRICARCRQALKTAFLNSPIIVPEETPQCP